MFLVMNAVLIAEFKPQIIYKLGLGLQRSRGGTALLKRLHNNSMPKFMFPHQSSQFWLFFFTAAWVNWSRRFRVRISSSLNTQAMSNFLTICPATLKPVAIPASISFLHLWLWSVRNLSMKLKLISCMCAQLPSFIMHMPFCVYIYIYDGWRVNTHHIKHTTCTMCNFRRRFVRYYWYSKL